MVITFTSSIGSNYESNWPHFISAINFSYSASEPYLAFSAEVECGGCMVEFEAQGTLLIPCEWSVVGAGGGGGGTAL